MPQRYWIFIIFVSVFYSRLLTICFLMLSVQALGSDTTMRRKPSSYRNYVLIGFNYGRQTPVGVLSQRFNGSNTVGTSLMYKFGRNWQLQAGLNALFSGTVRENGVLDSMIGQGGLLLDVNGTYAPVKMYQRGYHWHADIGKIFNTGAFNKNSGILLSAGLGFLEHKIKFTFQRTVLPQMEGEYYKGYDRLTNGLMLRGFAGYQRLDPEGMFNYFAGLEVLNGFTKNRRAFNYDTRRAETELRNDLLIGIKFGIMISLGGREAGLKRSEQERFFD